MFEAIILLEKVDISLFSVTGSSFVHVGMLCLDVVMELGKLYWDFVMKLEIFFYIRMRGFVTNLLKCSHLMLDVVI